MADDISRSSTPRLFLPGVLHNVVYNNIPGCLDLTAIDRETLSVQDTHPHRCALARGGVQRVTDVGMSCDAHRQRPQQRSKQEDGALCCDHIGYRCSHPSFISCLIDTPTVQLFSFPCDEVIYRGEIALRSCD